MRWLKQSTTITVQVGPYLDSTDGATAETALSPTIELSKAGAAFAARNSATAIAHDADGWYRVELDATDTATLGPLMLKGTETGVLPVWHEFMVLTANVYDSLVAGSDTLDVQVTGMGAGVVTAAAVATNAIDADALAADAATEIANAVAAPTAATVADAVWDEARAGHVAAGSFGEGAASVQGNVTGSVASVSGAVGSVTGAVGSVGTGGITAGSFAAGAIDAAAIATDAIGSAELAATAVTEIVNGVWDEATSGHVTAGTTGKALGDTVAAVDTEVAAIKAKTDNLPAAPAATGDIPSAAAVADAVWDEATTGHTTAGTFGEQLKTDVDAILVDTAEIGAAGAGLTALATQVSVNTIDDLLDTEIAAIKSDTAAILADTGTDGVVVADKTGYALSAAGVDAILDESLTELVAVPAAAPTLRQALQWLFMMARNKITTTATQMKVHNDAGTAVGTAAVSDDGTTFERAKHA